MLTHGSLSRKFGKQIQKRQLEVPEYAASFVNYKALKKVSPVALPSFRYPLFSFRPDSVSVRQSRVLVPRLRCHLPRATHTGYSYCTVFTPSSIPPQSLPTRRLLRDIFILALLDPP